MKLKNKYIKTLKGFAAGISHLKKLLQCDDPLDGDQIEVLSQMVNIELDFQNGNITSKEYTERYAKLNMEIL